MTVAELHQVIGLLVALLVAATLLGHYEPPCENPQCREHHRRHRAAEGAAMREQQQRQAHDAWHTAEHPVKGCHWCRTE